MTTKGLWPNPKLWAFRTWILFTGAYCCFWLQPPPGIGFWKDKWQRKEYEEESGKEVSARPGSRGLSTSGSCLKQGRGSWRLSFLLHPTIAHPAQAGLGVHPRSTDPPPGCVSRQPHLHTTPPHTAPRPGHSWSPQGPHPLIPADPCPRPWHLNLSPLGPLRKHVTFQTGQEAHARWTHLCWTPPMGRAQTHNPKHQHPLLLCHSSALGTPLHAPALMCLTELIHLCCTRVCEPWLHSLQPNPEFCQHRVWNPDEPLTGALRVHPQDSGPECILCMPTPGTRRPWGWQDARRRSIPQGSGACPSEDRTPMRRGPLPQMHDDRVQAVFVGHCAPWGKGIGVQPPPSWWGSLFMGC